jgi:hypothetical protein
MSLLMHYSAAVYSRQCAHQWPASGRSIIGKPLTSFPKQAPCKWLLRSLQHVVVGLQNRSPASQSRLHAACRIVSERCHVMLLAGHDGRPATALMTWPHHDSGDCHRHWVSHCGWAVAVQAHALGSLHEGVLTCCPCPAQVLCLSRKCQARCTLRHGRRVIPLTTPG